MILRHLTWFLVFILINSLLSNQAQNARSYDTSDWIPITPNSNTNNADETKRASGRVLNLDVPSQKFFPDDEFLRKRPTLPQQYLRETSFPKARPSKHESPYKFEEVVAFRPDKYRPQYVPQYSQQGLLGRDLAPPPQNTQNYYNTKAPPQIQSNYIPQNKSLYQSLNPTLINREILGAIQNEQNLPQALPLVRSTTSKPPRAEALSAENVQLLYVPVENLQPNHPIPQQSQTILRGIPSQPNRFPSKQNQLEGIEDDFIRQALAAHKLQQQFQQGEQIVLQSAPVPSTTPKPRKRKAHQPPLAVYMEKEGRAQIDDVLSMLKNAKSISVQDTITPNSPQIFVGPSNLQYTDGYTKFPLPYLSNLDGNSIEKKQEQLPFFVAPLSYKTPDGYSKIPLPSPHVGSVVISTKTHELQQSQPQSVPQQNPYIVNPEPKATGLLGIGNEFYQSGGPQQFDPAPVEYNVRPQLEQNPPRALVLNDFRANPQPQLVQNPPQEYVLDDFRSGQYYQSTPNFERTTQPQYLEEVPTYITPKPQQSHQVFRFGPENVRTTTTTTTTTTTERPSTTSRSRPETTQDPVYPAFTYNRRDPLRQVINQYDIEQINSEFVDDSRQSSTAQAQDELDLSRIKPRPRQRTRPTTTTTTTTTQAPTEKYRVLEEFSIKPTTSKYTTEVETIPAHVYKLEEPQQVTGSLYEPSEPQQQTPGSVYKLEQEPQQPQNIYRLQTQQPQTVYEFETEPQGPFFQAPLPNIKQLNQQMLDQQILQNTKVVQEQGPQDPHSEPLLYNRGQGQEEVYPQDGLLSNLQNQAVRPLLLPNLLVPTERVQVATTTQTPYIEEISLVPTTTEAPKPETTTRRTRGRQRANSSSRTTSTTSTPRRTASRRRPSHRTTERPSSPSEEYQNYEATRKSTTNTRQRFRTRARPAATERVSQQTTTEAVFKQPPLESGFQISQQPQQQSFLQYEQPINIQQLITVKPEAEDSVMKEYHQVYTLPTQTETTAKVESTPREDFVRTNIQSGGVIYNNRDEATSRTTPVRVRGRGRPRTTTTTTARPARRPSVLTTTPREQSQGEEEEFYGFMRTPNFNRPAPLVHTTQEPTPVYSSSYRTIPTRITIQEEETEASKITTPIQFVGEIIRPKSTTQTSQEASSETPRIKTRGRVRIPVRKTTDQGSEIRSSEEPATRRSSVRTRTRGGSHYKPPQSKKPNDDEDVEGGNYPASYLRSKGGNSNQNSFKIMLEPSEDDDQVPHSSIYSPSVVKKPESEWVEASNAPPQNELKNEEEADKITENEDEETTTDAVETEESADDATITTVLPVETTTALKKQKGKRRGVWKLVKQKPVDHFEGAESQNFHSVLNSFDDIGKENPTEKPSTTTESNLFDTLYSMFGINSQEGHDSTEVSNDTITTTFSSVTTVENETDITTTIASPTFPEEFTETTTQIEEEKAETTDVPAQTSTESPPQEIGQDIFNLFDLKTSTSTEVSHETEICFKGRCVRAKDEQKRLS